MIGGRGGSLCLVVLHKSGSEFHMNWFNRQNWISNIQQGISNDQGWKSLRSTVLFCSVSGYSILFYFKSSTFGQINNPTPHKELQSRLQPTWMLIIRGSLSKAAIAAKGWATEAAVFRVGYWIFVFQHGVFCRERLLYYWFRPLIELCGTVVTFLYNIDWV